LKFGVEVRGNGTRWWSAVGGYLRYSPALASHSYLTIVVDDLLSFGAII
jgi:hypothetical protein